MKHIKNLQELLNSGEARFDPGFIINSDGSIELLEISIVPNKKQDKEKIKAALAQR